MIRSLFTRSGVYFFGLTLGKALSVIVFILFARALLPEQFGNFVFFVTLIQLVTFFADVGLVQWYQKQSAQSDDQNILLSKVIITRFFTYVISAILSMFFLFLTGTFTPLITIIFLLTLFPEAFLSVLDGFYLEKNKSFKVSLKQSIRLVIILFGYLVFLPVFTVQHAVSLYLVASVITLIWYLPFLQIISLRFIPLSGIKSVLKKSKHYGFLIFSSFLYARGDSLVIRYSLGNAALGLYGSAYRYLESLSLIPTALSHNLFPLSAKREVVTKNHLAFLTLFMLMTGIIAGLLLFFLSEFLITFLLGTQYNEAVPILKIFSLVVVLFFVNSPLNTVLQSSNIVKKFLPYGFINTALNIVLNIILIPVYGVIAASVVMLLTELTGLFINLYFVRKVYSSR
ncbi:polysaccharide biosynthesis C-terminal domain-containing protein [Candidatus Roizmanbacteria bacterium]|nr:polysaccharide biosynthesis C-terminal domain-containing protein [Candidatus Roizmanbacteria bacterium]